MAPDERPEEGGESGDAGPASAVRPLTAEQQALVESGLPLLAACAASVVRSFHYLPIEAEELLAPGAIALREAAIAYDAGSHATFATYARYHIRGRMVDAIRAEHFSLRARMERSMDRGMAFCESHQVTEPGAPGDPDEQTLAATHRGLAEALAASVIAGTLALTEESPEEVAVLRIALREGMGTLLPVEQEVVRLYYEEGMTLDEIAAETRVHMTTVKRRHGNALRKLRKLIEG